MRQYLKASDGPVSTSNHGGYKHVSEITLVIFIFPQDQNLPINATRIRTLNL